MDGLLEGDPVGGTPPPPLIGEWDGDPEGICDGIDAGAFDGTSDALFEGFSPRLPRNWETAQVFMGGEVVPSSERCFGKTYLRGIGDKKYFPKFSIYQKGIMLRNIQLPLSGSGSFLNSQLVIVLPP